MREAILIIAGLVAGSIDSIAGGGGLITLPVLYLTLEQGSIAVGTNKIVGTLAALLALIVYARKGLVPWRWGLVYSLCVGMGAIVGSLLNRFITPTFFPWLLLLTCPFMLFLIWEKNRFIENRTEIAKTHFPKLFFAGFCVGIYDGAWGPGGGTLMFLALFLVGKRGLLESIACGRLANTFSAGFSLVSYASQGLVVWRTGIVLGAAISVGAFVGARYASERAQHLIRPALTLITFLLLIRVIWTLF